MNYGESKASDIISQRDRRVEIDVNLGKLYQKNYTEALQAVSDKDFGSANKAINQWLRYVPPDQAIFALFDCWGDGEKATMFKKDLLKRIKNKFYRDQEFKYILDSLYCENQKDGGINWDISMNKLPTYEGKCKKKVQTNRTQNLQEIADKIYSNHGFPIKELVGKLGNNTLPSIILSSEDIEYLEKYLPLIREACEKEQISWRYYASLYDKISSMNTGFQRYGTQIYQNDKGTISFHVPIEDINILNEYRKQVKLVPYPDNIIEETRKNQKDLDTASIKILNEIYQSDQKYRLQINEIEFKYGKDSDTLKAHRNLINTMDSINLLQVKDILDNRGWISSKIVGHQGNSTIFLVIQHSDIETQLFYLPMLKDAVKQGNAQAGELAMLEDRIAIRQGKKQIYGTQVEKDDQTGEYFVSPLLDPENVNERRAEVGLGTIEKYLSHWGIKWDITELDRKK